MVEMLRLKIVQDGSFFHIERKVRKEWIPILSENGNVTTFTSREVAEMYIDKLSKEAQLNYRM